MASEEGSSGVPPLPNAHRTIGYALKRAQHAMRQRMDRGLKPLGLSAPQYAVLASLEAEPGASNAALARRAFVTPQTMQGMLVKLERAGLVARAPDADHGRIQRTELTEAGRTALVRAHRIAAEVERAAVQAIAPFDRDETFDMLTRCVDALA